jgi:hypothetical protein
MTTNGVVEALVFGFFGALSLSLSFSLSGNNLHNTRQKQGTS